MVHREAKHVAVSLGPHAGHPPGVREQADLAKVGAVRQRGGHLAAGHDNVDDALLESQDLLSPKL